MSLCDFFLELSFQKDTHTIGDNARYFLVYCPANFELISPQKTLA